MSTAGTPAARKAQVIVADRGALVDELRAAERRGALDQIASVSHGVDCDSRFSRRSLSPIMSTRISAPICFSVPSAAAVCT